MNDIITLAKELSEKRSQVEQSTEYLAGLKAEKDEIQNNLIIAMKELGLKSLKTDTHNFARTVKKDIRVNDPDSVMQYLQSAGEYDQYVKPKLDTIAFKSYAKSLLKATGEVIDGTELTESEYMSIKTNI